MGRVLTSNGDLEWIENKVRSTTTRCHLHDSFRPRRKETQPHEPTVEGVVFSYYHTHSLPRGQLIRTATNPSEPQNSALRIGKFKTR